MLDLKVKGMNSMGKKNPSGGIIRGSMPQFITSDHRGGGANGAQSILALQWPSKLPVAPCVFDQVYCLPLPLGLLWSTQWGEKWSQVARTLTVQIVKISINSADYLHAGPMAWSLSMRSGTTLIYITRHCLLYHISWALRGEASGIP